MGVSGDLGTAASRLRGIAALLKGAEFKDPGVSLSYVLRAKQELGGLTDLGGAIGRHAQIAASTASRAIGALHTAEWDHSSVQQGAIGASVLATRLEMLAAEIERLPASRR
jgi:hypothetical protein